MKRIKTYIPILILIFVIQSCDCIQHVQGVVIDRTTNKPIANTLVLSYYKNILHLDTLTIDSNGIFDYTRMTGGIFRCPKIKLLIRNKGFEDVLKEYKSCCTDNDTIFVIQTK